VWPRYNGTLESIYILNPTPGTGPANIWVQCPLHWNEFYDIPPFPSQSVPALAGTWSGYSMVDQQWRNCTRPLTIIVEGSSITWWFDNNKTTSALAHISEAPANQLVIDLFVSNVFDQECFLWKLINGQLSTLDSQVNSSCLASWTDAQYGNNDCQTGGLVRQFVLQCIAGPCLSGSNISITPNRTVLYVIVTVVGTISIISAVTWYRRRKTQQETYDPLNL